MIKRYLNLFSGKISASTLELVEKAHFDGKYLKKVVIIAQSEKDVRKREREFKPKHLESESVKWKSERYKLTFELDLNLRPEGLRMGDLMLATQKVSSYKPYLESHSYWQNAAEGWKQTGPVFTGFVVSDWLKIYVEPNRQFIPRSHINAFALTWEEEIIHVALDKSRTKKLTRVSVEEGWVDKHVQSLLMNEATLFVKNCLNLMSPQ